MEGMFENSRYYNDFVCRMTYHTNAIEGNALTYEQTQEILKGESLFDEQERFREYNETINHKEAFEYVLKTAQEPLCERLIIEIGKIITKNILDISGYRNQDVYIRGSKHTPPTWCKIREHMMYYVYNYNMAASEIFSQDNSGVLEKASDIFLFVANMHLGFERIHPFQDGNGRTGRLLIAREFIKNNLPCPIIRLEDRGEYIAMLESRDAIALARLLEQRAAQELEHIKKFVKNKNK